MTVAAKNVMCYIYEQYCITKCREQIFNLSLCDLNYEIATSVIKELKQGGFISKVEKIGQTYYRLFVEDKLIEYYG